ncbi:fimbrial protein [Moellerella wisconsensis]|uniref:Type 1 fimbrial protein n=1 Tax=Moellerella wisconsensis TaxID=158849 RepID=A0ACD3Y7S0_9GAMM|nr:fimbrial protein [Moellerella wisconsensis]KLN95742.1 hypothetical protein VK86_13730 [Moellerella wisconsensis]UNH24311.1 type 1 fimbrial protein [Moellerella wisconsensis]UNH27416.1 type 1 fimbrial protein [Moellerella wisconsensis]UNH39035.1 type 1 fimbrial protein [Moellerella wisconsensis]UNH42554.1 type 1 fimbrial protein [Moellerella wisconsensis]
MNNKLVLSATVALIFAVSPVLAADKASGGVINFQGMITDTTCTINGGNSNDLTIALAPITVEQAKSQGLIEDGKEAFSLEFSNCSFSNSESLDAGSKALNINFSSNKIDSTGQFLQSNEKDANGNVKNIGIAIVKQGESNPINLHKAFAVSDITASTKGVTPVRFYAQYYKPSAAAADAGKITTMVTYSLSYM